MKLFRILSLRSASLMVFCVTVCCCWSNASAQPQEQVAPPPLKIVTRQDRTQLEAERDPKARVKLTLELADAHLGEAEKQTTQLNYDEAAAAAGKYAALIEDVFAFVGTLKQDSNKTRDLYKRVELALRTDGTRLTIIRRSTPAAYAVWMKDIEEFARHGRTEALNSFYGQTVVRDRPPPPPPGSPPKTVQNNVIPPEKKP